MSKLVQQLKPILFPVRMIEAPTEQFSYNKNIDHLVVVDLREGEKVVNACSKGYTLIPNIELFKPMAEKLEQRYKVEAIIKSYRDSKFYVDFIIKDLFIQVMKGDILYPRLRAANSYDGSLTYRFNFGFFRIFCENQINANAEILEMDEEDLEGWDDIKVRHTASATEAVNKTLSGLEAFIEFAPKMKQVYKQMIKTEYTEQKAIKRLEIIVDITKYPPLSTEYALQQLQKEKTKFPLNDYIIYNCLNFGLYHNPKSQMKDHKKDKVDLKVLDYILNH